MLHERVRRTIARFGMLARGDRVLVALSGGPDSSALTAVLARLAEELEISVHAAHFNHRTRAAESDRDAEAAGRIACLHGVPISFGSASVPFGAANFEATARSARYTFLKETAVAAGCSKIATGHTRDDQAETLLMRIVRGTGIDGLRGILPVRADGVVRPLIDCDRAAVLEYLRACNLPFVIDSSNSDARFLRNRVRQEVLPMLRRVNPAVDDALVRLAATAREEALSLDHCVASAWPSVRHGETALGIRGLRELPDWLLRQILRRWLAERRGGLTGIGARHLSAVVTVVTGAQPNAWVRLPGGGVVERAYDTLIFRADAAAAPPWDPCTLDMGREVRLPHGWRFTASEDLHPVVDADPLVFRADAGLLPGPLVLRPAARGDRLRPFGMEGRRKLQDVFVDRGVPRSRRWTHPVLTAGDEIVWVPGLVRGAAAPVSASTVRVLEIRAVRPF